MNQLEISKQHDSLKVTNGSGGNGSNLPSLSSTSSGNSIDNTSISSSQNIQISDDNNSSSGNGSDSDEFCTAANSLLMASDGTNLKDNRYWEILPNLTSFQSYPIEDVVFCHCDVVQPNVLVWVVRHLAKMIALVTAFRTKVESEQLFQKYRELRVSVKSVKNNMKVMNPNVPARISEVPPALNVPITLCPPQQPPIPADSELVPYSSLPHVLPTEILYESKLQSPLFFASHGETSSKLQDFSFDDGVRSVNSKNNNNQYNNSIRAGQSNTINSYSKLTKSVMGSPWSSSSLIKAPTSQSSSPSPIIFPHRQNHHFLHSSIKRFDGLPSLSNENNANESEDDSDSVEVESQQESFKSPFSRPLRKTGDATSSTSTLTSILQTKPATITTKSTTSKPVVLVPLKTETVSSPRPIYPKESYLYHVMGRTSSTFAPYQRSINFLPQYAAINASANGSEYFAWGNDRQGQLLVPFSSWMETSESANKQNGTVTRKMCYAVPKARPSASRNMSRTSTLAQLNSGKGTAKILLRDSAGNHHGMWATLSQRFKRNIRESLMQKLNGVWPNGEATTIRGKKKAKKVTFNAWATVQMV